MPALDIRPMVGTHGGGTRGPQTDKPHVTHVGTWQRETAAPHVSPVALGVKIRFGVGSSAQPRRTAPHRASDRNAPSRTAISTSSSASASASGAYQSGR